MLLRSIVAALAFGAHAASAEDCNRQAGPFLEQLAAQSKSCDHVLCGRVLQLGVRDSSVAPSSCADDPWTALKAAALAAMAAHGILILGEAHDSAAHHLLQAAAVREFAKTGDDPTGVVFEQIGDDQRQGLDRFEEFTRSAARPATAADLKRFIGWDKSGWPKDLYDPLFETVVGEKLPIYAGDVPRAAIMTVAREGPRSISPSEQKRLGLDLPLGQKSDAASLAEIEEAHCGAIPKSAFGGMAYAQRYRDAHLADAALVASDRGSAILITGTGHARTDRGVPWYVGRRAPGKKVVSVMFVEVEAGKTDAEAYVLRDPEGKPAADFLVFTPRAERGDPCEKMRAK